MSMEDFINGFQKTTDPIAISISDRFPDFKIRALTAEEDKRIRNESTERKTINARKGKYEEKLNKDLYMDKLIIESVVEPNFKDAKLQDALGVMGATAVLNMLTAGEYIALMQAVTDVNGFDLTQEEKDEEVKN